MLVTVTVTVMVVLMTIMMVQPVEDYEVSDLMEGALHVRGMHVL